MVSANDVGRLFLQAMLSRRVVSDKLARILWGKCVDAVQAADEGLDIAYDYTRIDDFIGELNGRLEPLDLKLSSTIDETVGKKIWALVNLKGDELAQVATDYSPVEIAYFKALIEQIVLASSESYSISSMTALREVNNLKPSMTKSQAEVVLANFVAKGWLVKSKRSRFCLSSRALLELQGYLKSNFEDDIHECTVCFELVTIGVGCYTPRCGARLHQHCYKHFSRNNSICPSCKSNWADRKKLLIIGEGALKDGEDSRIVRRREEDLNSEEEAEESDGSEGEEPSPKPTKKSKVEPVKRKERFVREEASDDDEEADVDDESPASKSRAHRQRR